MFKTCYDYIKVKENISTSVFLSLPKDLRIIFINMSLFKSEYIFVSRKDKKKNLVRGPVLSTFSEKSPLKTFFSFSF